MHQDQQSRWRPTRRQVLWTVGIVFALLVLIRIGYALPGTGFGQSKAAQGVQPAKTLWDWMDLLIVPVVLALGGYFLNSSQNRATQAAAERRAQDETLQAYLDQMSDLLIPPSKDLPSLYKARPGDSLSSVARARTLTVLPRLDGDRKARVLEFLYQAGLIAIGRPVLALHRADLTGANLVARANLEYADLSGVALSEANLGGAYLNQANLEYADLSRADLSWPDLGEHGVSLNGANLRYANLREANLRRTDLSRADLSGADLSGAYLSGAELGKANLSRANLFKANLSGVDPGEELSRVGATQFKAILVDADLSGAYLREADLSGAVLRGAVITNERLEQQAKSLKGATMPNGQQYEDWLKSKGRGEAGEHSGP